MITSLSIENFALIEKLSVSFSDGFSVITGETGAGKSILLGALGLVLGKRADLNSLKNKEEKCIIEAHFQIKNYNLKSFFEANDLDYEDETIIRREILPSGKSRAFINDTPVNLNELQDLSNYLIDIHSQHQTQELSDDGVQFQIIDSVASNFDLISDYSFKLKEYKKSKSNLKSKSELLQSVLKEQDYNTFLLEELLSANLKSGEQEELEVQYEKLNNVEFIKENLVKSLALANEEQIGVLENLKEIKLSFQKIANFSPEYNQLFERISSVLIEFDDVEKELSQLSENLFSDPEELDLINQKLQFIYTLQKKHQVNSVDELLSIQNDLDNKVVSVTTLESEIATIEKFIQEIEVQLNEIALKIHKNRAEAVPVLTDKLAAILEQLGMANARFNIQLTVKEEFYSNGKDEIQFLFSANKGSDFGLLKKVASGGEMSRIMLAVKSVLSQYSKLPTIIFDEIDTGVSGEIAHKMGEIMKSMSENMQVFAITHLPQIAGKGKDHFKVYKVIKENQTQSELKLLSNDERVIEIAQMLSGSTISDSALNHAKELLN
ncbi:DNA repair protein RecN [Flavobacterium aquatile]|uniref:DNA repair protein RecN n=1 Tax=Flavobacterium aquatile LMG 4008 = ATCC 11947 TaxID=1453498 RepID=A0A095TYL7_9FLAO|nr:DNA repair protein RecN [Flavobacterium aquatile]KGD67473.1 DNA recombination protein RecN [Flavobacterium aquatile LMG 4008 = ATCC 11947]OXA67010.1 DNA repair protein RecN [Flavobacterium aquatile] [Flavobacterium aquatile LMG 4008 = ATCC 11947]GEC79936.1 DNA repair protein RecN [Flavobacterium aquatile]